MRPNRSQRGFTGIDMAVSLAVAGIIMSFLITNLTRAQKSWRLRQATVEVAAALRAARAEAILERVTVNMPFNTDTGTFVEVLPAPTRYGATPTPTPTAAGGTRRRIDTLPRGIAFTGPNVSTAVALDPPGDTLIETTAQFDRLGKLLTSLGYPGYVYLGCASTGEYRRIVVERSGNIRTQTYRSGNWS